jgi:C-terminal processing protease CtpA/Prc
VSDLGPDGLRPWISSIELAKQTGKTFSDAFSYTSKDRCNSEDRVIFPAPAIVVTSAMTFSAAEFFAACFQDHGGKILGVDETTGGGGAGVRTDLQLRKYFTDAGQQSPYIDLNAEAKGAGFQVAYRRTRRVGLNAGKDIEDIGVQRNLSYAMTRDDLLYDNRDLKNEAIRLLMTP